MTSVRPLTNSEAGLCGRRFQRCLPQCERLASFTKQPCVPSRNCRGKEGGETMIMAVAALVREKPKPSDADINNAIKPNSQTPTPASLPPRNRSSMCGRPTPGGDPLDSLIPPGACGRGQRQSGPPVVVTQGGGIPCLRHPVLGAMANALRVGDRPRVAPGMGCCWAGKGGLGCSFMAISLGGGGSSSTGG